MKPITVEMRRSALIALLRHPEDWPAGFTFFFNDCAKCGMGLASKALGMKSCHAEGTRKWIMETAKFFGLTWVEAAHVFGGAGWAEDPWMHVTPEMLADKLEAMHRRKIAEAKAHAS